MAVEPTHVLSIQRTTGGGALVTVQTPSGARVRLTFIGGQLSTTSLEDAIQIATSMTTTQ